MFHAAVRTFRPGARPRRVNASTHGRSVSPSTIGPINLSDEPQTPPFRLELPKLPYDVRLTYIKILTFLSARDLDEVPWFVALVPGVVFLDDFSVRLRDYFVLLEQTTESTDRVDDFITPPLDDGCRVEAHGEGG